MTGRFDKAFEFVIGVEGTISSDPDDPGGLTKYGISQRAYPQKDISNLSLDDAKAIYKSDYWDMCRCDNCLPPMDIIIFDTAVNMGCSTALKLLQASQSPANYLLLRVGEYAKFKGFNSYGRGWINRIMKLYNFILKEN